MNNILVFETPHVPQLPFFVKRNNVSVELLQLLIDGRKNIDANFDKDDQPHDNDDVNHKYWYFLNDNGMDDDDNTSHTDDDDLDLNFDREDIHNLVESIDKETVSVPKEEPKFP